MKNRIDRSAIRFVATAFLALAALGCNSFIEGSTEGESAEPQTQVAIVFDSTSSFAHNMGPALEVVKGFMSRNAISGEASIYLFRMDNDPKYVKRLPAYTVLKSETKELLDSLGKPSSESGTDVVGALRLAIEKLHRTGPNDVRYLLAFTDGNVDPSKVGGRLRSFGSLAEFDWNELKGIRTRFYFLDRAPCQTILSQVAGKGLDIKALEAPDGIDARTIAQFLEGS